MPLGKPMIADATVKAPISFAVPMLTLPALLKLNPAPSIGPVHGVCEPPPAVIGTPLMRYVPLVMLTSPTRLSQPNPIRSPRCDIRPVAAAVAGIGERHPAARGGRESQMIDALQHDLCLPVQG